MIKCRNILLLLLLVFQAYGQNIVVNEFVSDNNSLVDADGDFSDWIELYNTGNTAIDLENFSLSDDLNMLEKWRFPSVTIPAKGFLLVFASSKNRYGTELHTNFKISSNGEALFLSSPTLGMIDQTPNVALGENVSFGRLPDGSANLITLQDASPNASNNANNQLLFSDESGFYTTTINLTITSLNNDPIYYTLDGSVPDLNSNLLSGALLLKERHNEPNVLSEIETTAPDEAIYCQEWIAPKVRIDKAVVLRSASYNSSGARTSEIYTKTYFIDKETGKYDLPVVSLVTDPENLFNQDSGIYVPGVHFDLNHPDNTGNFYQRGDDWERPIHIEYYEEDGALGFKQNAGVRIHGAISRQGAQKSFRMYARSAYGEKQFNYPLLPQRNHSTYKRFVLRTSSGVTTRDEVCFKDELANDIAKNLNIDYQAFRPVVLFLNGEYWGIYSIRDRLDKYFVEYTNNIDKDEIEFYEDNPTHFEQLKDFIRTNDLAVKANFDYVKTQIELDNFIDTYISELFFANTDWPSNNNIRWRPTTPGGKWRWIFYDLDFGMIETHENMLEHATGTDSTIVWPNPAESTFLFRNFLKNEAFVDQFLNRYFEIMDTDFNRSKMLTKLDALKAIYSKEINRQSERWQYPENYSEWESDINKYLVSFLKQRSCIIEKNISQFFDYPKVDYHCFDTIVNPIQDTELILAPNPCSDYFFLYNRSDNTIEGDYIIFNVVGHIVDQNYDIVLHPGEKQYFRLENQSRQNCILKFHGKEKSFVKKIVIIP